MKSMVFETQCARRTESIRVPPLRSEQLEGALHVNGSPEASALGVCHQPKLLLAFLIAVTLVRTLPS